MSANARYISKNGKVLTIDSLREDREPTDVGDIKKITKLGVRIATVLRELLRDKSWGQNFGGVSS